jgi:hypothetical protein
MVDVRKRGASGWLRGGAVTRDGREFRLTVGEAARYEQPLRVQVRNDRPILGMRQIPILGMGPYISKVQTGDRDPRPCGEAVAGTAPPEKEA